MPRARRRRSRSRSRSRSRYAKRDAHSGREGILGRVGRIVLDDDGVVC